MIKLSNQRKREQDLAKNNNDDGVIEKKCEMDFAERLCWCRQKFSFPHHAFRFQSQTSVSPPAKACLSPVNLRVEITRS